MPCLPRASRYWAQFALNLFLLVLALALVQATAERNNHRWDLTPTHALSLSEPTRKVLAEVRDELSITVFYRRGTRQRYTDLLGLFRAANPRVRFELLDLDRYPGRARAAGVSSYGRAVLRYHGRRTVVSGAREDLLAGGVLRVLRGRSRHIYFLAGHGERRPAAQPGKVGLGFAAAALKAENYEIAPLGLIGGGKVPGDADLVVVAGPRRDLLAGELVALDGYLERGGGVLLLLDPGRLPRVAAFLRRHGIRLGDDMIVDRENRIVGTEGLVALVPYYRTHPATEASDVPAVLPSARSVRPLGEEEKGGKVHAVAATARGSWAEHDIAKARRGAAVRPAGEEERGPVPVMVVASVPVGKAEDAGERGREEGRLAIIGDVDFASDAYIDLLGNRDLLLNTVSWLAGEETLLARHPRHNPELLRPLSPVVITEHQGRMIFLTAVIGEPGLVLLAGVAVVVFRRRRG